MEVMYRSIAASCAIVVLIWAWKVLNWAWLTPKRIEKCLRQQGFKGNPYRLLVGDLKESSIMLKQTMSRPIHVSQDIVERLMPHVVKTIQTYGKNSFTWMGRMPRVHVMEAELVKEILTNYNSFQKNHHANHPLTKLLLTGIGSLEGEKWAKHRRIISPSFHLEKLKNMLPAFYATYDQLLTKWEENSVNGSIEVDVFPIFDTSTSDVISRVAFGSNYHEAGKIFLLIKELLDLTVDVMHSVYIPGSSFLPTKRNKRMRAVDKEIKERLSSIVNNRMKEVKVGEPCGDDDLLGMLLHSNMMEIERQGNQIKAGMSLDDVISECKLFFFAGQETTGILLTWTFVLLSTHPHWQDRAREEVLQVFGDAKPDFTHVQSLKIITMILYEVLRLYPPVIELTKVTHGETKLGKLTIPAGVQLMMPLILLHRDVDMWGEDSKEFNPGRFAEGVSKATKSPLFYIPFSYGPRVCLGQNFALLQAKMALALILQRFSFQLSQSYAHAPFTVLTLQPQHGCPIIFHKLKS